jgi:hypothetical protein
MSENTCELSNIDDGMDEAEREGVNGDDDDDDDDDDDVS